MSTYTKTRDDAITNGASLSSSDKLLAASLALLSTFILGYSATRVILNAATTNSVEQEAVIPHQASGWSALGEHRFE